MRQTQGACSAHFSFLSVPALQTPAALNAVNEARLEIVTRAKKNCVAFEKPGPRENQGRAARSGARQAAVPAGRECMRNQSQRMRSAIPTCAAESNELYFRDYLTEHPDAAKQYVALKKQSTPSSGTIGTRTRMPRRALCANAPHRCGKHIRVSARAEHSMDEDILWNSRVRCRIVGVRNERSRA